MRRNSVVLVEVKNGLFDLNLFNVHASVCLNISGHDRHICPLTYIEYPESDIGI